MLIKSIEVENWRSFHGENKIVFSMDPVRNVTLIRAENGVGKTSLLAALSWCLYGRIPDNMLEMNDQIVNRHALEHDGVTEAVVTIEFVHDEKTYRIRRSHVHGGKVWEDFKIFKIEERGLIPREEGGLDNASFINSVIPHEMSPHFFFFGESRGKSVAETQAEKFGKAVKEILGAKVANMALDGIRRVGKEYDKAATDETGHKALIVQELIDRMETAIHHKTEEMARLENESAAALNKSEEISEYLGKIEAAKNEQEKMDGLRKQLDEEKKSNTDVIAEKRKWPWRHGLAILADRMITDASRILEEEKNTGKLPFPYGKKFVEDILKRKKCICGAHLADGTREYRDVGSLLESAGDPAAMSRIIGVEVVFDQLKRDVGNAWDKYDDIENDITKSASRIDDIKDEMETISKTLSMSEDSMIREKENARRLAREDHENARTRIGKLDLEKEILLKDKSEKERELATLQMGSERAAGFKKLSDFARALCDDLTNRLNEEKEDAKKEIEGTINDMIEKSMRKFSRVKLTANFEIHLFDRDDRKCPKSTGENQLLGLAFTAALAKYAKDRKGKTSDILLPGVTAPLVVDSPFGELDGTYRGYVAEFLPEHASQVILLISSSHASESVMRKLVHKVGRQFVLIRHNTDDGEGKPREFSEINGRIYDTTVYSCEFDGTNITEVP